ncbi:MAG: signal peptidase I [Bacillota bacterium]|nr:signal peptidase I [Bacillota bacterium]
MQRKQRDYRNWKQSNAPYLIAMALAFVMFMVIAPEVNEGNAMAPTLKDGDVLVVSKTAYNPNRKPPEKDSMVILEKTYAQDVYEDNIIGRVVGHPGDTVAIKNGKVLVNGKEYVTDDGIAGAPEDMKKVKLEMDEVFLLCDNRDELIDSRNPDMGPVDMREIKGNVLLRVWPFSDIEYLKKK